MLISQDGLLLIIEPIRCDLAAFAVEDERIIPGRDAHASINLGTGYRPLKKPVKLST